MRPADPTRRWRGPDAGIAEHGDTQWHASDLREFLAGALRGRGEAQAAVELFWQAFVSHPSLATYRRLLDEAAEPRSGADKPEQPDNPEQPDKPEQPDNPEQSDKPEQPDNPEQSDKPEQPDNPEQSDKPAGWQQRCEEELRSRLSRLDGRVPGDRGASNAAVPRAAEALVEILAYEGRVEAAWNAATVHGCAERMWMTLARAREKTHPSDAMGVYEPRVLELINRKKTQAYRSAVDLMERIRHLADAANEPGPLQVASRAGAHRAQGQAQPQEAARRQRLVKLRAPRRRDSHSGVHGSPRRSWTPPTRRMYVRWLAVPVVDAAGGSSDYLAPRAAGSDGDRRPA